MHGSTFLRLHCVACHALEDRYNFIHLNFDEVCSANISYQSSAMLSVATQGKLFEHLFAAVVSSTPTVLGAQA
jgi:hypothetical protein